MCYFLTSHRTSVLDDDAHLDGVLTLGFDNGLGELERGVAETEAEGIGHILLEGVEIAIAHVDVLLVVGIGMSSDGALVGHHVLETVVVDLAWEVLRRGMVGGSNGPRHGEFARRIDFTRKQVGDRVAALHTRLPGAENGIGILAPRGCLDDTSRVDDDDDGFADGMEGIADVGDKCTLLRDEVELGFDVAVDTLTGLTTDGDDSGIGPAHLFVDGNGRETDLRVFLLAHHLGLVPLGGMTLSLELHAGIGDVFAVDIGQGCARLDASVLQTLEHIDDIRRMDASRACAAGKEVVGVLAKQSDGLDIAFPRQGAVVLQEHDALAGTLAGDGGMGLEVGSVRGGVFVDTRGLDDVFKHTTHVAVDILDIELATLHTLDDLLGLSGLSGFHEIVASLYLTCGGQTFADANPVGHDDALETPVVAQNLGEQVVVAHRELTVDLVI